MDFDTARHPDFSRYATRWEMAYDFWRGGLHVLQPATGGVEVSWAVEREPSGQDSEPALPRNRYQWFSKPGDSYLYKHTRETAREYEDRARRAINMPMFQYVVNVLAAGVLRDWPFRDGVDGWWLDYHADVDMAGTDIDSFMRRALSLGLVFGRVHAVTDMPASDGSAPSAAHQEARGERPYSYLVTPLDLVDWSMDRHGKWDWAVIREPAPAPREPGETYRAEDHGLCQYRVWTPDSWAVYRRVSSGGVIRGDGGWVVEESGTHGLGRVPITTLYCTRLADAAAMGCETPLPDVLDLNHHLVNELSELDETDRAQAFAILGIPVIDGVRTGGMDIGPNRGLAYPSEAGAPEYIAPDGAAPAGRWERLMDKAFLGRQLAAVSRGKAEFSKEERSASAITVESEDKRNQLAWWSKALQEFDLGLHRDVAAWLEDDSPPTAAYSTNFDVKGLMVEVQELVQLSAVDVVSGARKTVAQLAKPIVRKMLREQGATKQEIDAALSDLERSGNTEPAPEPVPAMPPQADDIRQDDPE